MHDNLARAKNWKIIGINKPDQPIRVGYTGSGRVGVSLSVYGGMPYRIQGIPEWAGVRYGCRRSAGDGLWVGSSGMALDIPANDGAERDAAVRFTFPNAVYKKDERGLRVLGENGCYLTEDFEAVLHIIQEANPDYVEPVADEPEGVKEGEEPDLQQLVFELFALVAELGAKVDEQAMQIAALSKPKNTPF